MIDRETDLSSLHVGSENRLCEDLLWHINCVLICLDSHDGFQEAADAVDHAQLRAKFLEISGRRRTFAADLQRFVELTGEQPPRKGSFVAAFHRAWMSVRETFSSNDTYAILAEVERGEDRIKAAYEHSLTTVPGSPLNDLLQKQYVDIKQDHDEIRDLRDALAPK